MSTLFTLPGRHKPRIVSKQEGLDNGIDTGASLSLVSEKTYNSLSLPTDTCRPTDCTQSTYTGEKLTILGFWDVQVEYQTQSQVLHC